MKSTRLLFQCVLLVLLESCALWPNWENKQKKAEKSLNKHLIDGNYCNGELIVYSEYLLKLLLQDHRFAICVYKPYKDFKESKSECLKQLVDFLSFLCEREPGFTVKYFVFIATAEFESKFTGFDDDDDIEKAIRATAEYEYDVDFQVTNNDFFKDILKIKPMHQVTNEEGEIDLQFKRSAVVKILVDNFGLYYNNTTEDKFVKFKKNMIKVRNRLKGTMLLLLMNAPADALRNPPWYAFAPDKRKRPKTYCGLSGKCVTYILGGTAVGGIVGAVGLVAWNVFFRSTPGPTVSSTRFLPSSSSLAPATLPNKDIVIVAVLVLIAIALCIIWYYKKYMSEETASPASTTPKATSKNKKNNKEKKQHKKKAKKDSSSSTHDSSSSSTSKTKVPIDKHENVKKRRSPHVPVKKHRSPKKKSPKSRVQPSSVATGLIGPSVSEHLFDKANKPTGTSNATYNRKQSKESSSLIGASGSFDWNQPQAAVSGMPNGVPKISSPIPSTVSAVTDRKKANLKQKSTEPKTNVISSGKETSDRAIVSKKK